MKIGVVVGTFGDDEWRDLGESTLQSVRWYHCEYVEWIHVHGQDLAGARNKGARYLSLVHGVDHLIFLDADDSLNPSYVKEMGEAIREGGPGIYRPSTLGVYPDGSEDDEAVMIPRTHMANRNCIIVGAACPADVFEEVGGFDSSLEALEDWDLWCKMILAGVKVRDVPGAVYRVGVNEGSRNSLVRQKATHSHGRSYSIIRARNRSQAAKLDIR